MSQTALAHRIGVRQPSVINDLLAGRNRNPRQATVGRIAVVLGVRWEWLATGALPRDIAPHNARPPHPATVRSPTSDAPVTPPLYHHLMDGEVPWSQEEVRMVVEECEAILSRGIVAGELMGSRWGRAFLKGLWRNAREYCKRQDGGEPMADAFGAAVFALEEAESRHENSGGVT